MSWEKLATSIWLLLVLGDRRQLWIKWKIATILVTNVFLSAIYNYAQEHDKHILITLFWMRIHSTKNEHKNMTNIDWLPFSGWECIQLKISKFWLFILNRVWKSHSFCSWDIALNMYSYACELPTSFRKLDLCRRNLDQNTLKHCESAPYIITHEKMINMMIQKRFKLFVYFVYLLMTFKPIIIRKPIWEITFLRNKFWLLWQRLTLF